jgi:hypothetical protein
MTIMLIIQLSNNYEINIKIEDTRIFNMVKSKDGKTSTTKLMDEYIIH